MELSEKDRETLEAAVLLARVIYSPGVEGPCGQNPVVDWLATKILTYKVLLKNTDEAIEAHRLWALYLQHEDKLLAGHDPA